ncbi:MAG: N-6 DNA methylase [Cetobacterium sp.]
MERFLYETGDSLRSKFNSDEIIELSIVFSFYKLFDDINRDKEHIKKSYKLTKYAVNVDMERLRQNPTYLELEAQLKEVFKSFPSFHEIIKSLKKMDEIQIKDIIWRVTDLLKSELNFGEDLVRSRYMIIYEKIQSIFKIVARNSIIFTTPDSVIEILNKILQVSSDETLMDPCFGIGNLAIKVGRNAKEIIGYDINEKVLDFGKILLETAGKEGEIEAKDSLDEKLKYADVVASHIPFSIKSTKEDYGNRDYLHWGIPGRASEDFSFISLIVSQMNKRGAIIVPEGILFRGGADQLIRKNLIEEGLISGIISLPGGIFAPYTGIATSIIFFDKEKKSKEVFILDGKEYFKKLTRVTSITEENLNKLVEEYKLRKEIPGISRLLSTKELSQNEYILNSNRYIEMVKEVKNIKEIEKEVTNSYQIALENKKVSDEILKQL